jgi:UrcA family protein
MFTNSRRSHAMTLAVSALLGLGAAGAASAADAAHAVHSANTSAPAITVSYRDLDLSRPADVQALYRRLQHAAASVCMPVSQVELSRYMAWKRCYNSALDSAVLEVRSPELLALYGSAASSSAKHGQG